MLFQNILKHHIFLLFSSRKLLLIFLVFYIIFAYNSPLYCADINVINKSLNKNEISASVSDLIINSSNEIKVLTPPKQISPKFKNLFAAIKNSKSILPPHGLYKFETVNINKNSFLVKKPISIKPSKIKTLSQTIKNKASKPLRIGAIKAPVRIEDNPDIPDPTNAIPMQPVLTEFPSASSFPEKMCAEEVSAVDLLKKMHKAIADGASESNVLSMYITIVQNYSSYQYLTALARFYFEECKLMRSNGYVYTGTAYYEAYNQLSAMYSHEKTSKNGIYSFILQKCDERQKQIQNNNSQIEKEIKYIKWSLDPYFLNEALRRIEAKEYTESPYYSNVPTEKTFWEQYNVYLENYRKLIKNYLLTRNFSEASKAMAEYEKFYTNNIKRFHTVKYYKDNDTLLTKQIEIFRDAEEHLNFIRQYVALVSYQAQVNQENNLFKSEIENYVKVMETYQKSTGSETASSEKISDEKLELYKSHASSSNIHEQNNYYRNKVQIVFSGFTKSEGLYQLSEEIHNPRNTLKIWFVTDGTAPLHAFKVSLTIKSSISRREKTALFEFKPDSMAPYYFTKFIPNETDDDSLEPLPQPPPTNPPSTTITTSSIKLSSPIGIPPKNLINNTRDALKESIACFDSEDITPKSWMLYRENKYFFNDKNEHNCLGYSFDIKYSEANQNFYNKLDPEIRTDLLVTDLSKSFLKAGGFEWISLKSNESIFQFPPSFVAIRNQADWLIIDAHGSDQAGSGNHGGIVSDTSFKINVPPYEFMLSDGRSEYSEDIDVLVLPLCACLNWIGAHKPTDTLKDLKFSKGWQKVLPNGVILGYKGTINEANGYEAVSDLSVNIEQSSEKLTPDAIVNLWREINAQRYYGCLYTPNMSEKKVEQVKSTAPKFVCIKSNKRLSASKNSSVHRISMLWPKITYHFFDKYIINDFYNINEGDNDE